METFRIWHQHADREHKTVSFLATAMQTQGLNRGTDDLVEKMLEDMGVDAKVKSWKLDRIATDYLSDDRDSTDWRDVWAETGAIEVILDKAVVLHPSPAGFVETTAFDETWKGKSKTPDTCLVVLDFSTKTAADKAAGMLEKLSDAKTGSRIDAVVREVFPRVAKHVLEEVVDLSSRFSFDVRRCHEPRQLHLAIPATKTFFANGAKEAVAIERLGDAIGGTSQWRERAD